MNLVSKKWVVATDGSVDDIAGISVFAYIGDGGIRKAEVVYGLCSTSCELAAIEAALCAAPLGVSVRVLTDCYGAVKAINRHKSGKGISKWDREHTNKDIKKYWESIKIHLDEKDVEAVWVKAHHENVRNKEVDKFARRTLRITRMVDAGQMNPWFQMRLI